ncbi:arrestin domain-containing protein 3-like, partial [Rhynchophorus ferrugineus]|uniref:arrestin domain-containing protein 3-like n=1 Tax=Rhynchophorus ferrugineus TaxID=354439 RepID=UPI003FCDC52D
ILNNISTSEDLTGDTITGKVVCNFNSGKQFRKISIRLKCQEQTEWTDTESHYNQHTKKNELRTITRTGHNDLYNNQIILQNEGTLPPGHYEYPISLQIPEHLPSSFKGSYGSIRYILKAVVDRPWKIDMEDILDLHIDSPIKLNNLPADVKDPVELSDEKTVGCFCCASGEITLTVSLERQAFAVGENIYVKTYCLNMSNANVVRLSYDVKSKLTYKTTSPSVDHKYDSELITQNVEGGVGAHSERECIVMLEIPPTSPVYNFTGCSLFKYHFELTVTAEISGCHTDIDLSKKIYLGHIPYNTAQYPSQYPSPIGFLPPIPMPLPIPQNVPTENQTGPSAPMEELTPSAPPKSILSNDSNTDNQTINEAPPPSYDEATSINKPK